METTLHKICNKCNQSKPLDDYAKHPNTKDRRANTCKECAKELSKYYRAKSLDAYREKDRIRNSLPERKEQSRQWEITNRLKRREQERIYDFANRADVNAKMKKWREKNPVKDKANSLKWRESNRETIREKMKIYSLEYYRKNPDKAAAGTHRYRKRAKENGGVFTSSEWRQLKEKYNFTCLMCYKSEPEIKLGPDHVIPLSKGGRNDIANIQPLCKKCNRIKSAKHIDYRFIYDFKSRANALKEQHDVA